MFPRRRPVNRPRNWWSWWGWMVLKTPCRVTFRVVWPNVWRWLAPHVEAAMRAPVVAYIGVIAIMVACAVGTLRALPIAGAVAFFVSDLAVARDRFIAPGFDNRAWGLPLYYAAVTLLALSTA